MTYTKPQIAQLGNASKVIQGSKNQKPLENVILKTRTPSPAYDMDE
jgi:hypothetical protein